MTEAAQVQPRQQAASDRRQLEPISPEEAIQMYLTDRGNELRSSSLRQHESALRFFEQWCTQNGVENLNSLTGRNLNRYRVWRRDEASEKVDSLAKETQRSQLKILSLFIRYCESIDAVAMGLHEQIRLPSLARGEKSRDDMVEPEQATDICSHLRKYEYGSLEHVVWTILTETGMRTGTARALDVEDYYPDADIPHVKIVNRDETGTALKNGDHAERSISVSSTCCEILDDYLDTTRPDEEDEYGREPLLTAGFGRVSTGTIRRYVYKWTRPCAIGGECPHGRNRESCEATEHGKQSKCPSSNAAHAIRRGYITHELQSGVNRSFVSDRCDVSEEVIEEHYDERDQMDRMRVRRREMAESREDTKKYGK